VTGGASGIGRATAVACAREGAAAVALADVEDGGGLTTVDELRAAGAVATAHRCDVRVDQDVEALIAAAVEAHGRLDCAFNNAGVGGKVAVIGEYERDDLEAVLDVDLRGVWSCLRHELLHMAPRGTGAIVNCSSTAGV